MTLVRFVVVACLLFLPTLGGCMQRVAVEGRSDQLYAEAKGALESEGFRPIGRHSTLPGAKGNSKAEGRLQFLYYADTIAPTVVEVRIEPQLELADGSDAAQPVAAGAVRGAEAPATAPTSATKTASKTATQTSGPHSVVISAWSSLTYAPDPWITDLALGVIRRAYLLSGNIR